MSTERDPDAPSDRDVADVRLTFRTRKRNVVKLERIAVAHDLTVGERPSVGAAINFVIEGYDDRKEQKAASKKATPKKLAGKKLIVKTKKPSRKPNKG